MTEHQRFLRDPASREALYYDADGACERCGAPLEDAWHADHVIPYSVVPRTNVFEMQSLCRTCNEEKGASMPFSIDRTKLRPGQSGAIDTIVARRRAGKRFTSIVLPTRYGKSDVARSSALLMMEAGMVSNALIVTPAKNLVEQMLEDAKLTSSATLYGFDRAAFHPVQTINAPPRIRRLKEAKLSAITNGMATRHLATLEYWVDTMLQSRTGLGLPPVVYVDEAHLGSDGNRWGNITKTLAEVGAYVVSMTATPFRSDGRPIPGFPVDREVVVSTSRGERVVYEVEPHHETTLQEAMAEPVPPIAHITYQPFGIEGDLNIDEETIVRVVLDDLDDDQIRRTYREALRKPIVMERAIRFFLTELRNRRTDPKQAKASGIIFVGNHEAEFDHWESEHAFRAKAIVNQLAPRLRAEVVVSTEDDAQNLLDDFLMENVDVVIVKQMGAIGLDAPNLKVALDLSNTRSRAYFLQRFMRIATRWVVEGYPDEPVLHGTYIAPDDRITRGLIDDLFEGTGVLVATTEAVEPDGGDTIEVKPIREPNEREQPMFDAQDVVLTGNLRDDQGTEVPAAFVPVTDSFRARFEQANDISKAALADWLRGVGVNPDSQIPVASTDMDTMAADPPRPRDRGETAADTLDMTKALNAVRKKGHRAGRNAINERFRRLHGAYTPERRDEYRKLAGLFWVRHFQRVGLPEGTRLQTIDDKDKLEALLKNIETESKEDDNGIH